MSESPKFDYLGGLMCKFCKSPMKDARILFCGHSFCLQCVETLAKKDFKRIPCLFGCPTVTPQIPPEALTKNLTIQDVFHDPPRTSIPTTPPEATKNREAMQNWKEAVDEAVGDLKADLKQLTDEARTTAQLLEKGGVETVLDKEVEKLLETWKEPTAFDWEKALEDLIRFRNDVGELLWDLDAGFLKIKQLMEEGFVRKEVDLEPEFELETSPPRPQERCTDKEARKTVWVKWEALPTAGKPSRLGGVGRGVPVQKQMRGEASELPKLRKTTWIQGSGGKSSLGLLSRMREQV